MKFARQYIVGLTSFIGLLCLCSGSAWAQMDFHFRNLSIEQGLSQSSVSAICEDEKGNIWIGTGDGLNKYDGEEFKIFRSQGKTKSGLLSSKILKLFIDQNHHLFIYTAEGVQVMNLQSEKFSHQEEHQIYKFQSPTQYDDSLVLFTDAFNGLYTYNAFTHTVKEAFPHLKKYLEGKNIVQIAIHKNKIALVTHNGEVILLDKAGKIIATIDCKTTLEKCKWYNGELYLATTNEGLLKINIPTKKVERITSSINALNINGLQELDEQLLCFSYGNGILALDDNTFSLKQRKNLSLMYNFILSSLKDKYGNLWIGTDGEGLLVYDRLNEKFKNIAPKKLGSARSIVQTGKNEFAIATFSNGVFSYNYLTKTLQRISYNKDKKSNALYYDAGKLWIGTSLSGVDIIDKKSGRLLHNIANIDPQLSETKSKIYKIAEIDNKVMVCTRDEGLGIYDRKNHTLLHKINTSNTTLPTNAVRCLQDYDAKHFLLGLESGGLVLINKKDFNIEKQILHIPNTESKFSVKHFWIDEKKNCWVGTDGDGILVFNPDWKLIREWNTSNILKNDVVYSIYPELGKNILWLSTNYGLGRVQYKLDKGVPNITSTRFFDATTGLQSNEFNTGAHCRTADNIFAFGGLYNVNIFNPKELNLKQKNLKVVIKSFMVVNKAYQSNRIISYLDKVSLSPGQNKFSIRFSATGLYNKNQLVYRYRLLGFEDEWQDLGSQNNINFTNMSSGRYRFHVQSRFLNANWSKDYTELVIEIGTPIWKQWWFILFTLALLGLLTWFFIRYRLQTIHKENRKKLQLVIESQELERQRISQELHDDFGARLSTLKLYLQAIKNKPEELNDLVKSTSEIIDRSIQELRNILLNLSPKSLSEDGLEITLQEIFRHLNKTSLIQADVSCSIFGKPKLSFAISAYRIILELINNTLKHAEATELAVSIVQRPDLIVLHYEDNGKGLPATQTSKGYGHDNIANHVQIHNGNHYFDSEPQHGLHFVAEFPMNVLETLQ